MTKNRLEAFSDGVLAIIVTIMVLEMKVPHSPEWDAVEPILPVFLSYILSFIFAIIYWNNHHHVIHTIKHVNGKIMWANAHLLFWLSLLPFVSGWMGENHFASKPVMLYGIVALMSGVAYYILEMTIIKSHGPNSLLARAVGQDKKGVVSVVLYSIAVGIALYYPLISCFIYVSVAIMWLIPDKRIENTVE
ncbi:MAG: DUF1211 domain-containing protein [Saprospiraceae bacterium]|nr:DUF1211 domain-containing protein [Saprospiraceae bacterium]